MTLNTYKVFWSPEGRCIATVTARDARAAKRKAPQPYRRYLGELYVELVPMTNREIIENAGDACTSIAGALVVWHVHTYLRMRGRLDVD